MFVLFNQELKRFLIHPKDGIWASEDRNEAQDLLDAAKQYVAAVGVPELVDQLIILEVSAESLNLQA